MCRCKCTYIYIYANYNTHYMYIYIYIYTYTIRHTHIYIYTYTCMYIYIYIYIWRSSRRATWVCIQEGIRWQLIGTTSIIFCAGSNMLCGECDISIYPFIHIYIYISFHPYLNNQLVVNLHFLKVGLGWFRLSNLHLGWSPFRWVLINHFSSTCFKDCGDFDNRLNQFHYKNNWISLVASWIPTL